MPSDERVYKDTADYVVRYADLVSPESMRGADLQTSCCGASVHNVCKASLRDESPRLLAAQAGIARSLNQLADKFGKARCNSVTILLQVKCRPPASPESSMFVLLARAWFKPKWQLWCHGEVVGCSAGPPPFLVKLVSEPARLCPSVSVVQVRTTDELALSIAPCAKSADGGTIAFAELEYNMAPGVAELLTMSVTGARPIEVVSSQARPPPNRALAEVRSLAPHAAPGGGEGSGHAEWQRRRAGRGRAHSSRGRGEAPQVVAASGEPTPAGGQRMLLPPPAQGPPEAMQPLVGIDEVPADLFGDLSGDDLQDIVDGHLHYLAGGDSENEATGQEGASGANEEVAEDEDAHMGVDVLESIAGGGIGEATSASSGRMPDDASPSGDAVGSSDAPMDPTGRVELVPLSAAAPLDVVAGPGPAGYFVDQRTQRHVVRISPVFNRSVSIKCYQHQKCQVAMAEWKLPSRHAIALWALEAEIVSTLDSPAEARRKVQQHIAAMKAMVASAQRPGRSRQDLLEEVSGAMAP